MASMTETPEEQRGREALIVSALDLLHGELASLRRALAAGHKIQAESETLHRAGAIIRALLPR